VAIWGSGWLKKGGYNEGTLYFIACTVKLFIIAGVSFSWILNLNAINMWFKYFIELIRKKLNNCMFVMLKYPWCTFLIWNSPGSIFLGKKMSLVLFECIICMQFYKINCQGKKKCLNLNPPLSITPPQNISLTLSTWRICLKLINPSNTHTHTLSVNH
jgi:hypothetical protein